jgi:hypothetical protein
LVRARLVLGVGSTVLVVGSASTWTSALGVGVVCESAVLPFLRVGVPSMPGLPRRTGRCILVMAGVVL